MRVGLPFSSFIGPGIPDMRAQNDFLRGPPSGWGAFRFDPVAALYLARPLAVNPAPLETGSFSPRPIAREGVFLAIYYFQVQTRMFLYQGLQSVLLKIAGKFLAANVR